MTGRQPVGTVAAPGRRRVVNRGAVIRPGEPADGTSPHVTPAMDAQLELLAGLLLPKLAGLLQGGHPPKPQVNQVGIPNEIKHAAMNGGALIKTVTPEGGTPGVDIKVSQVIDTRPESMGGHIARWTTIRDIASMVLEEYAKYLPKDPAQQDAALTGFTVLSASMNACRRY